MIKYIFGLLIYTSFLPQTYAATKVSSLSSRTSISLSKNSNITLNPQLKSIIYRKDNEVLYINPIDDGMLYTFKKTTKNYVYTIIQKNSPTGSKAGLIVTKNLVRYSEVDCGPQPQVVQLTEQLTEVAVKANDKSKIFDKSCDALLRKTTSLTLASSYFDLFNKEQSYIYRCFDNPKAKEKLESFPQLQKDVDYIISSITKDTNAIANNSLDLKIGCEEYQKDSKPVFNGKYKDNIITFPINDVGSVQVSACSSTDATMAHEYFHRAGVQNEKNIEIIDSICAQTLTPEIVAGSCGSSYSALNCDDPKGIKCYNSKSAMNHEVERIVKETAKDEQAKVQPKIVKNMEKVEIKNTQVTDKTWNDIAQDTTGKAAAQSPEVRKVAQETNANFNKFSNVLNASLSTVEPAHAESFDSQSNSPSMNLASSSSSRSPASAGSSDRGTISREVSKFEITVADRKSNSKMPSTRGTSAKSDEKYYTVEEYLVDQQRGFSGKSASNRGDSSTTSISPRQALAASSSTPNVAEGLVTTNSGADNTFQPGQQGGGANLSISGGNSPKTNSRVSNRGRNSGRSTASVGSAATSEMSILRDSPVIQGQEYSTIRSKYRKFSFTQELADQGINIYLKKDKISIGSKVNNSTLKFVDDGVSLRRVEK